MKLKKIAILDYGIGNVKSISNAVDRIGVLPELTSDAETILSADAVILPGVGAFAKGMDNLEKYKLIPVINDFVKTGKPFVGICLGMQMLFDESEEFGVTKGLSLVEGKVVKMPVVINNSEKLPHVGWNELRRPASALAQDVFWSGLSDHSSMYFVHSFVGVPSNPQEILATANYGNIDFCAAVKKGNVYGMQFHPEKSGLPGIQILKQLIN